MTSYAHEAKRKMQIFKRSAEGNKSNKRAIHRLFH